jgi:WD40 repeat protein
MDEPGRFALVLVAADDYADPPGRLPSSESAQRIADMLNERGGSVAQQVVVRRAEEARKVLARWAKHEDGSPLSSFLYLVGHGQSDGEDHWFLLPETGEQPSIDDAIQTRTLGKVLQQDWQHRQGDPARWTVVVLDCCASDIGVSNLIVELAGKLNRPRNLALWPVSTKGASHAGKFAEALAHCLETFNANDERIPLQELIRRIAAELGDVYPDGWLTDDAALQNPLRAEVPLAMGVDAYAELRRVVARQPPEVRSHFWTKALGAEIGEVAWHFCGRDAELAELSSWLREADRGLRVVTGEAGSGKSAVLGQLVVMANEELVGSMSRAGLELARPADQSPPAGVFDTVVHLTGKTLAESVRAVAAAAPGVGAEHQHGDIDAVLAGMARSPRRLTVLADALDEAQEPERTADFLRRAASLDKVRVIVGTRRSLTEGPDRPAGGEATELLDALGAGAGDLVEIERDADAQRQYVRRRLLASSSPYVGREAAVEAIAEQVTARDHPFLFARLATSELLARPRLGAEDPALAGLLARGHQGLFAAAVARLGEVNPASTALLHALAFARGRGLPQTSGIWVAIARAVCPEVAVTEADVQATLEQAAAYITLDGEAGQSTYRLAHQTFVEYFRGKRNGGEHRAVAVALRRLVDESGGWRVANYYAVRYLPEHLTADSDHAPPDSEELIGLVTDAIWLQRALARLGPSRLADVVAAAVNLGMFHWRPVDTVARALRRSRVALARDPDELAAQMYARLKREADPALQRLLAGLGEMAPDPWLRIRTAGMSWHADLETRFPVTGKVRALAFGRLDERMILAIGVDDRVELWDPWLGSPESVLHNDGARVTALSVAKLAGRTVVVIAAGYDGRMVLRDPVSGEQVGPLFPLPEYADSVALGLVGLGKRPVVAAAGNGRVWAWDAATGEAVPLLVEAADLHGSITSLITMDGRLAINVRESYMAASWSLFVDAQSGKPLGPALHQAELVWGPRVSAEVSGRLLSVTSARYLNGIYVVCSSKDEDVGGIAELGFPNACALAVGEVNSKVVVAAASEGHGTVQLRQTERALASFEKTGMSWARMPIWALCADPDGSVVALAGHRLRLVRFDLSGKRILVDDAPAPQRVAAVLTGTAAPSVTFSVLDHGEARFILIGKRAGSGSKGKSRRRRNSHSLRLRKEAPWEWPASAECYALLDGRPVFARGTYRGAVWIWDLQARDVLAGPFADVEKVIVPRLERKAMPSGVSSVTIGRLGSRDVLATAYAGKLDLWDIGSQSRLPAPPAGASHVTAVALGTLGEREVLVTGSEDGALTVWDLVSRQHLAGITLDDSIKCVWIVRGADIVGAMTRADMDDQLHLFDVVTATGW